ncbi:peritrophin-48-like [Polyergus mexicanus]|uniref:peritrophin-48-like n=1 Tax=Polyergus mexicanus TaxID=615972 RepID=UPI0038B55CAF
MKGIYLIAIAFLASRTAASVIIPNEFTFEAENECPPKDACPPKLIADKSNCGQFYKCKNGKKELVVCKEGLQFSKKWRGCVSRDKSDCSDGECQRNGNLLPHECQCDKFYECKNGQKALRECGSGQIFEKDKKICVPGENLNGKCTPNPGIECADGDFLPHECQCDKFYECKKNKKALRECSKGSVFKPASAKCVTGTACPKDTCRQGENKKHHCLCEKYYTCNNDDWVLTPCGKDQHFSPTELKCMMPQKACCDLKFCSDKPGEPGDCPKDVATRWPHECDCRLYYECEKNKKEIKSCTWGRYFDYVNQVCEKAEKISVKCKNTWDDWV